jgi:hypothetical protein
MLHVTLNLSCDLHLYLYYTGTLYSDYAVQYSGFHFDPQLASRAAGAPPARGTRGAVGGTGHIILFFVTMNRQGPFSEFSNFDYYIYRVRATGCLTKEERGRRIFSQKNSGSSLFV